MPSWKDDTERNAIAARIQQNLAHCYGSESFYAAGPLFRGSAMTEGIKALCDEAECYWLVDAVFSHHHAGDSALRQQHEEYFWTFTVTDPKTRAGTLKCDNGNGTILAIQKFNSSSMPMDEVKVWVGPRYGRDEKQCGWTALLPSER